MSDNQRQDSFLDKPGALDPLFNPRTLAVLSGSVEPDEVGLRLLDHLKQGGYEGALHTGLDAAEAGVDLALITAPAERLPRLLAECADRNVRFAALLAPLATDSPLLATLAGVKRPQLIGPNSIGLLRPWIGLHATTFPVTPRRGTVGFLTQSGALGAGILDWSVRANVGFSTFLSLGTIPSISWGDLIYRLGDDPHTRSILIYMESIGEARSFLSAAREVSLSKPIIVLKAGRTAAGSLAASEHSRQSPGDDAVLDAAFRRCGVLRVERISDLFYMSEVLSKQALPRGPRLAIVTNAAGPSILAVDALVATGGELARREGLTNPLGMAPGGTPGEFAQAVAEAGRDVHTDGVLAVLTPQSAATPAEVAEALRPHAHHPAKPLLASFLGGREAAGGVAILNEAGIPTVPYPDTAARSFTYMVRYALNLKSLYETPLAVGAGANVERHAVARTVFQQAKNEGRILLTPPECAELLGAYGIPAGSGGDVPLRLCSRPDEQFGPVLSLGAGGALSAFLPSESLALPPLNSTLARLLIERSCVWDGLSRSGLAVEPLEQAVLGLSALVSEQPRVREIALDPLWRTGSKIEAGAARIVLHASSIDDAGLPRLAIRPYPEQYVGSAVLKNGEEVRVRPIRAEDQPAMVEFHKGLSERSVYFRYFQILNLSQRTAHERLTRICFIDYARQMALVAERARGEIIGVGRFSRLRGMGDAEFAVLVADLWQGQGLGLELMRRLIEIARTEGITRVVGQILPENRGMIALARKAGFTIKDDLDEGVLEAALVL
jgi:acyl-CoA synthetase (NDP forming)/RimJ/RimL family protein N-acetyltransferase